MERTCCVTGPRKISTDKTISAKDGLRREIQSAVSDGYVHFISSFATDVDVWLGEIVLEQKAHDPALMLEAAIPYRKKLVSLYSDKKAKHLLLQCSIIGVHSEYYHPGCFVTCDRFITSHSSRIIVFYDRTDKNSMAFTRSSMMRHDIRMIEI